MATQPSPDERLVMYQVVAARHVGLDQMVWQVPGIALTAQAFLMTIGLGPGSGQLARLGSGLLSAVVAFMSVELLMRHRLSAIADAVWLERFERDQGWEVLHRPLNDRCTQLGVPMPRVARPRAYSVWIAGLSTFGLVGAAIAVNALVG
ncbi:hypothetical protein [Streptomyces sp. GbtcB6]|uniref:hypothetical protein n=1 Tax=Streptomyces sp. GbtcB6 TaxID=2824751 RepID=UPI001C2F4BD6|nr:hypothetical protein [Streptomyces sp. GbtcB6]